MEPQSIIITSENSDPQCSEGYWAHCKGAPLSDNPYPVDTKAHDDWEDGWHTCQLDQMNGQVQE